MRWNRAAVWLSAAALLSALTWLGHRLVFSQFQSYDDEGYLLLTVQQFLDGRPLYDAVYTQYGPAYYLWQEFLHGPIGVPVTHDATRLVTVAIWVASSALIGFLVWLLTRRPLLTTIGTAVAFLHLTQLTFEPGHPQELCLLALVSAVTIAMWRLLVNGRLGIAAAMIIGGLVAVTALTKVNVGAFLAGAFALGLATSLRPFAWRGAVTGIIFAAAMAAVPALMRGDLLRRDVAAWVIVVWSGLLAAFVARRGESGARVRGCEGAADRNVCAADRNVYAADRNVYAADRSVCAADGTVTAGELIACAAGFAIVSAAVVAAIVAHGTSPGALFEGLFVSPLLLPKVFWRPLPVPLVVAVLAPVSVLAALYCRRHANVVERWMPFVALACGLLMFGLSIAKAYRPLFAVGPLLVWVVARAQVRGSSAGERAARGLLAFAAILVALQAYPMPEGTQIVVGTVLLVPLALAAFADAEGRLVASDRSSVRQPSVRRRFILAVLALAVAANLGIRAQGLYASGVALAMPGAEAVRTTQRDAATYWWLNANLREHCDAFFTSPGLNSLHFWTGMPPVSTLNTTLWPLLFDDRQQQRIIASAAPVERFCVVWSPQRMNVLRRAPGVASRSLVEWLQQEFEPRASFGDWELRMRRGSSATSMYQGRRLDEGIALELPRIGHDAATRLALVDGDANRTLADSARGDDLVVLDEDGTRTHVAAGLDLSRPRRLTVRTAVAPRSSDHTSIVIPLWSRDGRLLAIVPVVLTPAD